MGPSLNFIRRHIMYESRWLVALLVLLGACSDTAPQGKQSDVGTDVGVSDAQSDALQDDLGTDATDATNNAPGPVVVEVLQTGQATVAEHLFTYELARVTDPDSGHVTYVQWNRPLDMPSTPHPVFVFTKPYVGIDWTGEAVDEKWAALGAGMHPDADEPSFAAETGSNIAYSQITPLQGVEEGAVPLLNQIPTLMLFGRFYAGGSIQDDRDDMVLGLRFLENRPDVDPARIAILGGSWGGFEAIYAAAYAPESVRPAYGIALYPLSDFAQETAYADQFPTLSVAGQRDMYMNFFEPYGRRIQATVEPNGSFAGFTHADIASRLSTPFIFLHDDHDTLVPFTMAEDLAKSLGDRAQYLWFRHEAPVDLNVDVPSHGPTPSAFPISMYSLTYASVLVQLLPSTNPLILVADSNDFQAMLLHLQAQEARGQGLSDFLKMLAALADARIQIFDLSANGFTAGPDFVAAGFNQAFGTDYTASNIQASLLAR